MNNNNYKKARLIKKQRLLVNKLRNSELLTRDELIEVLNISFDLQYHTERNIITLNGIDILRKSFIKAINHE